MDETELPLTGGDVTDGVVRVGSTVRRPRQAQSGSVKAYLAHLESVGFTAAPRWLGIDDRGRDILDYMEGDVPSVAPEPWATTDSALRAVAELLRALHQASSAFIPAPQAVWFGADVGLVLPEGLIQFEGPPELISHCDVTHQNVVFRDGSPAALIDFDMSRPTTRLMDVINTAMHWVPLMDPSDIGAAFDGIDAPGRLRNLVDAYGMAAADRGRLLDLYDLAAQRTWYRMRANADQLGGGWQRMWDAGVGERIVRRRSWMARGRGRFEKALR